MKRCVYCGKEYPDGVIACAIDGQPVRDVAPSSGIPTGSVVSIALFALLSAFSGVGLAWIVIATIANNMNGKSFAGHVDPIAGGTGDALVAGSIPILLAGGLLGFIAGLVGKTISVKRKLRAQQCAAPNGGPAAQLENSGVTKGPPSVS